MGHRATHFTRQRTFKFQGRTLRITVRRRTHRANFLGWRTTVESVFPYGAPHTYDYFGLSMPKAIRVAVEKYFAAREAMMEQGAEG